MVRLIPAHAGKTQPAHVRATSLRAHPRSRGENFGDTVRMLCSAGSSPLTRGKRGAGITNTSRSGLIPAHAGKTTRTTGATPSGWAHPRSRGENHISQIWAARKAGSSPLTRGKPRKDRAMSTAIGLIPAHAGKTCEWIVRCSDPGAHPRSRGENNLMNVAVSSMSGSSPLTRGKQS